MWATSVPILVFLGLSVLDLGPMYATDVRQTDVRRASSVNMPPTLVAGHNNELEPSVNAQPAFGRLQQPQRTTLCNWRPEHSRRLLRVVICHSLDSSGHGPMPDQEIKPLAQTK